MAQRDTVTRSGHLQSKSERVGHIDAQPAPTSKNISLTWSWPQIAPAELAACAAPYGPPARTHSTRCDPATVQTITDDDSVVHASVQVDPAQQKMEKLFIDFDGATDYARFEFSDLRSSTHDVEGIWSALLNGKRVGVGSFCARREGHAGDVEVKGVGDFDHLILSIQVNGSAASIRTMKPFAVSFQIPISAEPLETDGIAPCSDETSVEISLRKPSDHPTTAKAVIGGAFTYRAEQTLNQGDDFFLFAKASPKQSRQAQA